jgi:hypothetical protein
VCDYKISKRRKAEVENMKKILVFKDDGTLEALYMGGKASEFKKVSL